MKALRLKLSQTSANYRKEESIDNKMTYPLPPLSTVIGAIHTACGYREYHRMDISIQGKFESMSRKPYTDYCFLNSIMDDRGILVKMRNAQFLTNAYDKVASAKRPQGNSFRNQITIQVHNKEIMGEYLALKELQDELQNFKAERMTPVLELIKRRKKSLSEKKKSLSKDSIELEVVCNREKEIKEFEKRIKKEFEQYSKENCTEPLSRFRSLVTSLKYYELLHGITLVIHIKPEKEEELPFMLEQMCNLKSLGRSEDMVDVKEAAIVELSEQSDKDVYSKYSAYLGYEEVKNGQIYTQKEKADRAVFGTKYYLNKKYEIIDKKRIFEKKKVLYVSEYMIEETSDNVYVDYEGEETYIVNFV